MERYPSGVPKVFGDETVDAALARWLDGNRMELFRSERLKTGGSGGQLVSAVVRERDAHRKGGRRIIKLVAASPDAAAEPHNHALALNCGLPGTQDFIERHLVKLADKHFPVGNAWLMFQQPAGDGRSRTETLAAAGRRAGLAELAGNMVGGVLGEWNPEDPAMPTVPATEFVTELLGRRLDADAPLSKWIRRGLGPEALSLEWFLTGGHELPLPNPVLLAEGCPLSRYEVQDAARGRAHGDLHPGNIMVPIEPDAPADTYTLIDLSRFDEQALLARDPVHLLLCLVADSFLPHMLDDAREELITGLVGSGCTGPLIPQGLAELVNAVREATLGWGADRHLDAAWLHQWYLALQACSLMFIPRDGVSDRDRWWFFRLAARACWAYLDAMRESRPHQAPVLRLRTLSEATPVPSRGPALATVNGAPSAHAPVAAGRAEAAAAPAADQILALLEEIWSTFERPSEQLASLSANQVKGEAVDVIRTRAVSLRTDLRRQWNTPAAARSRVDEVVGLLRTVVDQATELRSSLQRMWAGLVPTRSVDQAVKDLAHSLDDLLTAVRNASMAVRAEVS